MLTSLREALDLCTENVFKYDLEYINVRLATFDTACCLRHPVCCLRHCRACMQPCQRSKPGSCLRYFCMQRLRMQQQNLSATARFCRTSWAGRRMLNQRCSLSLYAACPVRANSVTLSCRRAGPQ